jgi:hypothetical protein
MEQINIFFKKDVLDAFNELVFDLYANDYFSSLEYSILYKEKIILFIRNSIKTFPSKKSPKKLQHFGNQYIFYKPNQRTTWFIFFEESDTLFLITSIINNHSHFAKYLRE